MDAIAAVRAPVLANGKTGRESPIHVANVIRMSAVRARLKVDKPGHELGSGTGREWDSATLNSESSSRPGNRPDRARVPVVDVRTVEHKATAVRYGARAGVISDSVESSAKGKRVKFGLRESGEPDSQSEWAETGMHQSPMKSKLRNQIGTGNATKIPSLTVMRYPEGNSPGANVNGIVDKNSLLTSGRTETAPANIGSKASSGNGIETFVNNKWGH